MNFSIGDPVEVRRTVLTEGGNVNTDWVPATIVTLHTEGIGVAFADGTRQMLHKSPGAYRVPVRADEGPGPMDYFARSEFLRTIERKCSNLAAGIRGGFRMTEESQAEVWDDLAKRMRWVVQGADNDHWRPTHKHLKSGGLYQVLMYGVNEATMEDYVIYRNEVGRVFVRAQFTFEDGRFKEINE